MNIFYDVCTHSIPKTILSRAQTWSLGWSPQGYIFSAFITHYSTAVTLFHSFNWTVSCVLLVYGPLTCSYLSLSFIQHNEEEDLRSRHNFSSPTLCLSFSVRFFSSLGCVSVLWCHIAGVAVLVASMQANSGRERTPLPHTHPVQVSQCYVTYAHTLQTLCHSPT